MKLIVGLGNPGKNYENTRHNVGFFMIDQLRDFLHFSEWSDSKHKGLISEGIFQGEKILLLKPTTYMNLSGESVQSLLSFYKISSESDLLVLSDDIDMEFAKIRYRETGSHGGQNGLRSIIEKVGHDGFSRLKIGIGRDPRYSVSDWVLSKFQKEELEILQKEVFPQIYTKLEKWIE
ncbi:aminoacyl-tRNA hydrolase [Candidatus Gracilibacteria bacterium]|nr:aminoacyl-tRNA hydrolase [Candidatus Gracilibacteria bacterium]